MKNAFLKKDDFIYLRPLTESDISEDYIGWLNDREISRCLTWVGRFPNTSEKVAGFIRSCDDGNNLLLAIVFAGNDRHVGNVRLGPIDWIERKADIGIIIGDRDYWGRGIAKAATRLVLGHAFNTLGLRRITLDVLGFNERAIGMYEGLGFKREAVLRDHVFCEGSYRDVYLYGLAAEDAVLDRF